MKTTEDYISVLILVVVDNGLVLIAIKNSNIEPSAVLILVVVDNGLVLPYKTFKTFRIIKS